MSNIRAWTAVDINKSPALGRGSFQKGRRWGSFSFSSTRSLSTLTLCHSKNHHNANRPAITKIHHIVLHSPWKPRQNRTLSRSSASRKRHHTAPGPSGLGGHSKSRLIAEHGRGYFPCLSCATSLQSAPGAARCTILARRCSAISCFTGGPNEFGAATLAFVAERLYRCAAGKETTEE